VLKGIEEGLDSRERAERLNISVEIERNHMAHILARLGLHSRLQALVFALRNSVVEIEE
jgi:DNA-binding CsgD family transcriptional regulator